MKKNNQEQITQCILTHRQGYYRLAYTYVKNPQDALDIVQDAICKALDAHAKLQNPQEVRSWLYKIVVNTAKDFLRKSNRLVLTQDQQLESIAGSYTDDYEETDLLEALGKLSDENRTIIVLRFFEGFKLQEIAQIVEMPESTVKTRLYASLKKLGKELDEEGVL